jgi:hypothetical protein
MAGSLGGADGNIGAPTINVKNVDSGLPVRCRSYRSGSVHHQRYETSTTDSLSGAGAVDPAAPIINAKKHQRGAHLEVLTEIQEHSPST